MGSRRKVTARVSFSEEHSGKGDAGSHALPVMVGDFKSSQELVLVSSNLVAKRYQVTVAEKLNRQDGILDMYL